MADKSKRGTQAKPVSLHPLSLEDALRGVIATGPMAETDDQKRKRAAEQDRAAGRKAGQDSRGRKLPLKGEPDPES